MLSGGKVAVFDRFVAIFGQKYDSFSPKILAGPLKKELIIAASLSALKRSLLSFLVQYIFFIKKHR